MTPLRLMPKRKLPRRGIPGSVYLIHLDEPVGHARHYIGFSLDHAVRLEEHRASRGGRLLKAANARGISYDVVRVWTPADRRFERRAKNYASARTLCPVCNENSWQNWLPEVNDAKPIRKPKRKNDLGKVPAP